jgi:RNA polymerase sigma-70 factor (ECF subfamily)
MHDHHHAGEAGMDAEFLLALARAGDQAALGQLLERYRSYVRLLIRLQIRGRWRRTFDVDDLFREIGRRIRREIATFGGGSVGEFLSWVRRVIGSTLANQVRHSVGDGRRDLRLERALFDELESSSRALNRNLVVTRSPPGRRAVRREYAVILADALERLPEDYREVVILRNLEGIGFPEVARRMGCTEDRAKDVWVRALARLRRTLEDPG